MKKRISILFVLSMFVALLPGCGKKVETGKHGGKMVEASGYEFEPVFSNRGVELFVTRDMQPEPIDGVVGSATVEQEGKPPRWADLRSEGGRLLVPYSFPTMAGYSADVKFDIKGLGKNPEDQIEFSAPFEMTTLYGYTCLKHPAITTLRPGKCVKCGGTDKVETQVRFQCAVHNDVWALQYGECEKCGTTLVLRPVPKG